MNAKQFVDEHTDTAVTTITGVQYPDRLVARCARGDTIEGFVGDQQLFEILDGVEYNDEHVQRVLDGHVCEFTKAKDAASEDDVPHSIIENKAKQYALLERLFRRNHWGPFEHPTLTVGLKNVSIQTERQLTRHRLITADVQSLRYVDVSDSYQSIVPKSAVDADHATRHGTVDMEDDDRLRAQEIIEDGSNDAQSRYRVLRDLGMPAEDARITLGLGTQVNMTMTANLRTYLHILNLRESAGDAQWEIRGMTGLLKDRLEEWAPMTMELWDEHGPVPDGP